MSNKKSSICTPLSAETTLAIEGLKAGNVIVPSANLSFQGDNVSLIDDKPKNSDILPPPDTELSSDFIDLSATKPRIIVPTDGHSQIDTTSSVSSVITAQNALKR